MTTADPQPRSGRSYVVVPPADRPWRTRRAARVLVVAPGEREPEVLLLQDSDPGVPGVHWWVTPGGGIDAGETPAQTALREVLEETGHRAQPGDLSGPIAHRVARHGYSDQVLEQEEWFFLLAAPHFRVRTHGHTAEEREKLLGSRWWPVSSLACTDEWIWPAEILDLLAGGHAGSAGPLELGLVVAESTVAVGVDDEPPTRQE